MGVDFLSCHCCGEGFPDCGDYVYCSCGNYWCSDKCAEEEGFKEETEEYEDEEGYTVEADSNCKYCRNEDAEDTELLSFLLEYFQMTRDEALEMYIKDKSDE